VFILASASPSRRRLLAQAGLDLTVIVSGVDEEGLVSGWSDPTPREVAERLAEAKAAAVADLPEAAGALVLACDSVFDLDGAALGKPADAQEARRRWRQMRGRSGVLHTGHCLIDTASGASARETVSTTVTMGEADDAEIEDYIASGEPLQVAGGFTLDGRGAPFIAGVSGDPGNVIGVSVPAVRRLARALGFTWPELLAR
jgi:septum formation protein